MITVDYIGFKDAGRFITAHRMLASIPEQSYENLYQFLGIPNTALASELYTKADDLQRRFLPTSKIKERDLSAEAKIIFETPADKDSYDKWLKQQSTFQPVIDEAGKIRGSSNELTAHQLRNIVGTTAYPLGIDPFDVIRHLKSSNYRLGLYIQCGNCDADNYFFYAACYQCNTAFETGSGDAAIEFSRWLERSSGLLAVLEQAHLSSSEDWNLNAKALRKILRTAAIPWDIGAKETEQFLVDLGYQLESELECIKCRNAGRSTLNPFYFLFCKACSNSLGELIDCPKVKNHKSPEFARYCVPPGGPVCGAKIRYAKPAPSDLNLISGGAVVAPIRRSPNVHSNLTGRLDDEKILDDTPSSHSVESLGLEKAWSDAVASLDRQKGKKFSLGELLKDCKPESVLMDLESSVMTLSFSHKMHFDEFKEEIAVAATRNIVYEVFAASFGRPYIMRPILSGSGIGKPSQQGRQQALNRPKTLKVGDRIRHARFGEGVVEAVYELGADGRTRLEVRFDEDEGIKRLLLDQSPIEKISN